MDRTGWDYDWEGPRSRSEGKQREQDEALIRQLVEALEMVEKAMSFPVVQLALKAAHARLKEHT